jgi:ABC-type Zn uptake system ZnuABC Zn-binding protein ZnuA
LDKPVTFSETFMQRTVLVSFLLIALVALAACGGGEPQPAASSDAAILPVHDPDAQLPALTPVDRADGRLLNVVATSNIVADIVAAVGGEQIQLTNLLPAGADPHSYEAKPADLRALHDADAIFINGLGLEEAMESVLNSPENNAPVISVNVDVDTIELGTVKEDHGDADHDGEDHGEGNANGDNEGSQDGQQDDHEDHTHTGFDPHTWMDVSNVMDWTRTIAYALGELDPDNRTDYVDNAELLLAELVALDSEILDKTGTLPGSARKLVTDHNSLGYYARAYDFDVVGSVVSSFSTLASPSAQQLAALQKQITDENANAIFVSTAINPRTAEQIASDMKIEVIPLYIGSLSDVDGPASTYIEFMRTNTDAIVNALK